MAQKRWKKGSADTAFCAVTNLMANRRLCLRTLIALRLWQDVESLRQRSDELAMYLMCINLFVTGTAARSLPLAVSPSLTLPFSFTVRTFQS